jgi:hypothetical protein
LGNQTAFSFEVQRFRGSRFRGSEVQGSEVQRFKVQSSRFRVQGSGFRVQRFRVQGWALLPGLNLTAIRFFISSPGQRLGGN